MVDLMAALMVGMMDLNTVVAMVGWMVALKAEKSVEELVVQLVDSMAVMLVALSVLLTAA